MAVKSTKTISLAYKEKLLAEIEHYEKRIEEELNRRKPYSFKDESSGEDITNPYKLKLKSSHSGLKKQLASLSKRVNKTLELSSLTIMRSEVNIMVTPPEVRKPVPEDGVWYEVMAECKIDLVAFTINFYAHKPHRRFAPTRYRNVAVSLSKAAHEKELAQSILPKLYLPNLALQVLQSYATAFRSRRTTLLELAEKYADKLMMQAMPGGGYRVKFLDLLQVEWTLENMWSPVVPFVHRMKFEVEYMPKDYIQAIGKLYKQFKDPALGTSERTMVLSKIFDICLQAAEPARELQESFESDPETTGRLHERRTTIDQEPEVPPVDHWPKRKEPSGKENKPQNRKTSMAPPKTIPKKPKKSKPNENDNRRSVKRAIESESGNVSKKSRSDDNDKSKNAGLKGGRDGIDESDETRGKDATAKNGTGKDATAKKDSGRDATARINSGKDATAKTDTGKDAANNRDAEGVSLENNRPKNSGKVNAKNAKEKNSADTAISENDVTNKRDGKTAKSKGTEKEVGSSKNSEASSKGSKKGDAKLNKIVKSKDKAENNVASSKKEAENMATAKTTDNIVKTLVANTENHVAKSKKVVDNIVGTQNNNSVKNTDKSKERATKKGLENTGNKKEPKKVANAKKDDGSVASSKQITKKGADEVVPSKEKNVVNDVAVPYKATNKDDGENVVNTKNNNTKYKTNTKKVNDVDIGSGTGYKTVASNDGDGNIQSTSNDLKDTNKDVPSKKANKIPEKAVNVGKKLEGNEKPKAAVKKPTQKDINIVAQKEQATSDVSNKNSNEMLTENKVKNVKQSDKVVQKRKVVEEKPTETNKATTERNTDKEIGLAEKRNVTNKKNTEETGIDKNKIIVDKTSKTSLTRDNKTDKYNEILAKKSRTDTKNINNNNGNQPKNAITNKSGKPHNTKSLNTTRILKENTNRDETAKNVDKPMPTKNQESNMLNVTITKSKIIPESKLQTDKQIKIADKLKTKIPMMKTKLPFSSLGAALKTNSLAKISKGVEKTKIPQKTLPVFKKVAKNLPRRISPRKLPTFKPSGQGFSNK